MTRKLTTRLLILATAGLMLAGCLTVDGGNNRGQEQMEWHNEHQTR